MSKEDFGITVSDVHGTIETRSEQDGGIPYISGWLSREEFLRIQKLRQTKGLKILRQIVKPVPYTSTEAPFRTAVRKIFSTERPLNEKVGFLVNHLSHRQDFFYGFKPKEGVEERFMELSKTSLISSASGIMDCCEGDYRNMLVKHHFWKYFDHKDPAFLTPHSLPEGVWPVRNIQSAGLKLAVLVYFEAKYGKLPDLEDDIVEICELAAYGLGANVRNPDTEPIAQSRRLKIERPDYLKTLVGTQGSLTFQSTRASALIL